MSGERGGVIRELAGAQAGDPTLGRGSPGQHRHTGATATAHDNVLTHFDYVLHRENTVQAPELVVEVW